MAEKTPLNYQSIPKIKLLQAVEQKLFKNVNPCQSNSFLVVKHIPYFEKTRCQV